MKNISLYTLEGIACMFVIFIHCKFPEPVGDLVDTIARFAVPIFFIVSGFFNYSASKEKLKTRVFKLLRIFIFSSIIYILYNNFECYFINNNHNILGYNLEKINLQNIFNLVVFNYTHCIYSHLWFLLALMYCYIFRMLTKDKKIEKIYKFIPLLLLVAYGLNIYLVKNDLNMRYLSRNWLLTGVPFFVIGYLIKENIKRISSIKKGVIIPAAIIGLVLSIIERMIFKSNNMKQLELYLGTIIFVVNIFILAVKEPNLINIKFFNTIGEKYSLNIYIIHYLIINILTKVVAKIINININYYILPILVFIISYIIAVIISKIQGIKSNKKKVNI